MCECKVVAHDIYYVTVHEIALSAISLVIKVAISFGNLKVFIIYEPPKIERIFRKQKTRFLEPLKKGPV